MISEVERSPVDSAIVQARAGYAPPPELKVSDFSDAHIIVTSGPLAGTRWQTEFAPYQRGILDAFHEPGVEVVVVMGSSQWGKTACAVNVVAYHIANDPCPILVVEPTVDPMAKDFSTNRLGPVIAASPILRDTVGKKRARDGTNTTLAKSFRGGAIAIGGANSAASLASRAVRLLVLDEVDRYPPELPGEGSTLAIVMKRTQSYRRRRRILMLSSPTLEDAPIHSWFKRGDQRKFHVPCPACGHMHAFVWAQVKWTPGDPATAYLQCPACEHAITEGERVAILSRGEWRAEKPKRRDKAVVSFHLWEAYSPLSSLSEIVSNFLNAKEKQDAGDPAEMHTWQNTTLGEPRQQEDAKALDSTTLLTRRETYTHEVPDGACCLTMGVDVQDDRLEYLVIGWGPGEESWLIDRNTIPGDTSQPEPWRGLDDVLDQPYAHATGQTLMIQSSCIDSAGHRTTMVYDYAEKKAERRVYAIIGRDGQRPIVSSPSPKRWGRPQSTERAHERQVPLYTIGVDAAKALFLSRLKLTERGPGFVHFPAADWCDDELAKQFTSEKLLKKWKKGVPVEVWIKTRPRNEGLDLAVYAIAAMRLLNPKLGAMLDLLRRMAPEPDSGTPSSTPGAAAPARRPPARRVSRSSYLGR